jgi:hypothetical protein
VRGRANRVRRPAGPLTCGARDIRDVHRSAGNGIDAANPVCDHTFFPLAPYPGATSSCDRGRLAQLGEHLVYTERAGGSSPSPPTRARPGTHLIDRTQLKIEELEHALMRHRIYPMSKYRKRRATFRDHAPMRGTPRSPVVYRACARAGPPPGGERSFAPRLTWWPRVSYPAGLAAAVAAERTRGSSSVG